jgi:formiminotetrahydrofolate cyclodeaminase
MSTALSAMVGSLTHGKKGYEDHFSAHCDNSVQAQTLKDAFLADIDNDTAAFNDIMSAMKLPKKTDADKAARQTAMTEATRTAIDVPLGVLERSVHAVACAEIAATGNKNARSDAGVAALTAGAAAEGAFYNVLINLDGFADRAYATEATTRAEAALAEVTERVAALTETIRTELRA